MRASTIAQLVEGRLLGDDTEIAGISPITLAKKEDLSFIIWPKDIGFAKKCEAGCLIADISVVADFADEMRCALIAVSDLFVCMNRLKNLGLWLDRSHTIKAPSIAQDAVIHNSAKVGRSQIGSSAIIEAGVVIYDGVYIGSHTRIGANSVIGSDGFVPYGESVSKNLPSLGTVKILDHVRIGALCTIDRGLLGETLIQDHCLIDNMVHVGHDVVIKNNVIIAAQSGVAGFAFIDSDVTIGGQVGIAPHVRIKSGARISGKSMVHCDIEPYEIWSGNPSVPHAAYLRAYGHLMNSFKRRSWKQRASQSASKT